MLTMKKFFFDKIDLGFCPEIDESTEFPEAEWQSLLDGQAAGRVRSFDVSVNQF